MRSISQRNCVETNAEMKTNPYEWLFHLCTLIVQLKINRNIGIYIVRPIVHILFLRRTFEMERRNEKNVEIVKEQRTRY